MYLYFNSFIFLYIVYTVLYICFRIEESGGHLPTAASSELVEGLITVDQLDEATNIVLSMVAKNAHPTPRIFKFLLLKLASAGRVESIQALQRYITDHSLKRRLNYDNLLSTAYANAGRTQEVLDVLAKTIKDTPDTNLQELEQNFPRGGFMGILEKHPDYQPQGVYV